MKKDKLTNIIRQFSVPVLSVVLGLVLLLNPDTATVLVTKVIGWIILVSGAAKAISMATSRTGSVGDWLWSAMGAFLGVVILSRPLVLAESLGRIIGGVLVIRAIIDLRYSALRGGKVIAIITLIAGVLLFLTPMTLTRTILRLCGLVVVIIGIVNIVEKLRETKLLESGEKPKIIDADE